MRTFTDATAELLKPLPFWQDDYLELQSSADLQHFYAQTYRLDHSYSVPRKCFPSNCAHRDWWARIPERKEINKAHPAFNYTAYPHMQIAATDITAQVIHALWKQERLVFADDNTRTVYDYLISTCEAQEIVAENYARYKKQGTLPPGVADLEMCAALPLVPYQQVAAYNSGIIGNYGLFMEMGTGKTPTAIAVACNACARHQAAGSDIPFRVLIICPRGVKTNWQNEFTQFSTRSAEITILRGTQMNRVNQLIENSSAKDVDMRVVISSYETIKQSWNALVYMEWDLVICDESHMFKSHKTKRWQFLRELRSRSKARMVMTGTEVANSIMDLWTQLEFLGEGSSGFTSFESYRKFYGVYEQNGMSRTLTGVQNLPFMHERLSRLSYRISKKEALPDLPDKVYDIAEVEMSTEQAETYDKVAKSIALQAEEMLDNAENKSMSINSILTMLLRLAQITSGFVTWDETRDIFTDEIIQPKEIEWFDTNPKLDALCELLQGKQPEDKTIVWACWTPDLQAITDRLTQLGVNFVRFSNDEQQRLTAQAEFNNNPACKVFIGNQAAGGVGLNLLGHPVGLPLEQCTTHCNHEIFYSQRWPPIERWQAEDRAHRRGTHVHVRITDLCVPNSIDEEIRTRVLKKKENALLIGDIREILSNIIAGVGKHAD